MSKAFTRESDDAPDLPSPARPRSVLPAGAKNYLTPTGAARLREELDRLTQAVPANGDRGRRGVEADPRIAQLEETLRTATVVPAPPPPWDQVLFGATVTIREKDGGEDTFQIVGADESDPAQDRISWLSPIASALLNARLGERVHIRVPDGEREVEVIAIRYEET